ERFAGDNVDVDPRSQVVPILVLKRRFGAVLTGDMILVRLQARSQNRIARDGPIGIKPRFAGQSMRREKQIKDSHNQKHSHAEPDAPADSRLSVTSNQSTVA